ncbi:Cell wall-associated hydrolase, NlpC family [Butyrivibrio fibrisolvens DSM 3071]|uniref:Cell wall-associated hydrolase, NlpC family n=1 Tax=Butyrivibrio fibrisolvens DSM 3071 TaxID=1121131 RepID=A0A1M6A0W0_BUTFI|nr:C40 family peptidase [Butyrivibrio fibrisolvens]SHI29969.1 Cell wall-associated hydrolase, NlpC family [Butyrivibrio fibrisolvens DSM 3071]
MTRIKRIFSVLIIALLTTIQLVAVPVCATTSSDLKKQKEELENKKSETQDAYDSATDAAQEIAAEQSELGEQIDVANDQLVGLLADISLIEDEIETKEGEIETTQAAYDEAKAQEEQLYTEMCARIKYMYEKGETTYVEILMNATSFSDFTTKAEYVTQLYDYDRQQLEAYVQVQQEKAIYKVQLEEEKAELETTKEELAEEQALLQETLEEYKTLYADYETQLANAQAQAAAYKEQLKNQTQQIASLDSEIKAKEAEEEAARKAAEEAAKKAAQEASNSSGSGSGSSSSSNSNKTYAPAGEATGDNIAAYACQFVGNPYVFGGTSLTDGCDCSGFVYSVYKAFGITVPRTSYALNSAGTGVSYEEARPGDVIVYAGHCAIYLGNGRIVHASSAKTGIKYGYATYRTITSVRRFV